MFKLMPYNTNVRKRQGDGFSDFFNLMDDFFSERPRYTASMNLDIIDNEKDYLVEAELPGFKKEDINISYEDEILTISAEVKKEVDEKEENNEESPKYIHRERVCKRYERKIHLDGVKVDEIKAKLEDGILKVMIPKSEEKVNKYLIDID